MRATEMFELPYTDDTTVVRYVDDFYERMVAEKRIDVFVDIEEGKAFTAAGARL